MTDGQHLTPADLAASRATLATIPLDPAAVRQALEDGDGHSILSAPSLVAAGLPGALVLPLCTEHRSFYADARSTAYLDGRPVEALSGVSDLDLLSALCEHYGLSDETPSFGRGRAADLLVDRLRRHLASLETGPAGGQ